MRTVHKYTLLIRGLNNRVEMSIGARILAVEVRSDDRAAVDFWAEVDTEHDTEERLFYISGTGHAVPIDAEWIGTTRHEGSQLVWHIWELTP